jgi:hypothetical protein
MEPVLLRAGEVYWVPLPAGWSAGVTGGVSCRRGGVSPAPQDSLNVGTRVGDDPAHVATNVERLAQATGVPLPRAARLPLRHGAVAHVVERGGLGASGDALVTRVPGLPLALTVADCYPVFFAGSAQGVALAHAGWRGAHAGIASAALRALAAIAGLTPGALDAWVGPGIGPCCYDLPDEDAQRFPSRYRAPSRRGLAGRQSIDLAGFLEAELLAAGIAPERLTVSRLCTACRPDLFYSHRRDGGRTGRMLAWIMLEPPGRTPMRGDPYGLLFP